MWSVSRGEPLICDCDANPLGGKPGNPNSSRRCICCAPCCLLSVQWSSCVMHMTACRLQLLSYNRVQLFFCVLVVYSSAQYVPALGCTLHMCTDYAPYLRCSCSLPLQYCRCCCCCCCCMLLPLLLLPLLATALYMRASCYHIVRPTRCMHLLLTSDDQSVYGCLLQWVRL